MVAKVAQEGMVLVTWANFHYRDFVMNWVEHLRAVGCNAFIVGARRPVALFALACCVAKLHSSLLPAKPACLAAAHRAVASSQFLVTGAMDDKLLDFLIEREVPVFSMSSGLTLDDFGWGTPTFHKMVGASWRKAFRLGPRHAGCC